MELYPHQRDVLPKLKNGSVLNGGVGSGKTITSLAYYVQVCGGNLDRSHPMSKPMDLVVITTAKKRDELDWESDALHLGLFRDPELSYSGSAFIVDSWNNIKKYQARDNTFFIFDEQRLVGSGAWVKTFLKIAKNPTNHWMLLTATPADTWIDYVPLFVAHGFYRNRTDFVENHVVWSFHGKYRKIRGFFGVRHLEKLRDSILVEMPYQKHTLRHLILENVGYDKEMFDLVWKKLWNVFTGEPLIDVAEKYRVGRRVVNEDPTRLDKIIELQAKHPRLIVFYNFDYELEILRGLKDKLGIEVAEWNGHKHQPVPETDEWIYLVQYQAGAEGWNCTTTDAIAFYSLNYSHKIFEQAQGRTDRLDTPYTDLWYYVLKSDAKIDSLIWMALLGKKNFHEGRNIKFKKEN